MGIIPLRAYYYPAESQIEPPPDIQHADGSNATNRHSKTKTLNYIHSHNKTCMQASRNSPVEIQLGSHNHSPRAQMHVDTIGSVILQENIFPPSGFCLFGILCSLEILRSLAHADQILSHRCKRMSFYQPVTFV